MTKSQACISITTGNPEVAGENEIATASLHKAIARAIQEGWQIAPVEAHSKYASLTRSCIASPSNDPVQIARWAIDFPQANWCVETGRASQVIVLEVDHETGQETLCELCNDDWERWTETLQFRDDQSSSFLFRHTGQRFRFLSSQFKGVTIHAGSLVLLPPSWFVNGQTLSYSGFDAEVIECPDWLLDPARRNPDNVIPFPASSLRFIA